MLWNLCYLSQGFSAQVFKWQYRCLYWRFHRETIFCQGENNRDEKIIKKLYRMLGKAIEREDEVVAYQTLEMLKLSFGDHAAINEPGRMTCLCAAALQKKQYAIAGHLLEAYKSYLKTADIDEVEDALRGLILIIYFAKRIHQEYILGKAAACAFGGIFRLEAAGANKSELILDVIKIIGLNAIKEKDAALFQQTTECLLQIPLAIESQEKLHLLIGVWLHQLVKRDDETVMQLFFQFMRVLLAREVGLCLPEYIARESDNFIGIIGVNHRMKCKRALISFLLDTAQGSVQNTRRVAYHIGRMTRITISLHGMRQGFEVLLPVLEAGRSYLNKELRFIRLSNEKELEILFSLFHELTLLFELIARQEGQLTGTDVLMSFKEYWLSYYQKEVNRRSVNQFCQLLLKQMVSARKRRIRNLCEGGKTLLDYDLFSDNQIKKLGLG